MCRIPYGARWRHKKFHCPNLIPNKMDLDVFKSLEANKPVKVYVKYSEIIQHHDSILHFWNDWYRDYLNAKWPRLIVRMEDLVFHPKEVTKVVCECAGGQLNNGQFQFVVDSAKKGEAAHGKVRTSYVDALIRYGTEKGRYNGFEEADIEFARENLDPALMQAFGYKVSPPADVAMAVN
jgi:hypothetical protein